MLTAVAIVMLLLGVGTAFADCPYHQKHADTGYSSGSGTKATRVETGSTYMGRYEQHDARCLFTEIRRDHREIKEHLTAIDEGRVSERAMHWTELRNVLLPHMQAEERTLYPALQNTRAGLKEGLIGEEEHAAASSIFQRLDGGDTTSDRWFARFIVFKDAVWHHIAREEDKLFRAADRALGDDQLSDLCSTFMDQRQIASRNLPSVYQPASMQQSSSISTGQRDTSTSICNQCLGFDDLAMQDMTLQCPTCGVVVGTITPVSSGCVIYEDTAMPDSIASDTETQPQVETAVQQPTETQAQPAQPMNGGPMGTLRCPGCGAGMGAVCPSGPSAAAAAAAEPQPPNGAATPTSETTPANGGTTKY